MKHAIMIARGNFGKTWFIEIDGTVWCHDPSNEKGLVGDLVIFCFTSVMGPIFLPARGPWASTREALKKDTGLEVA